MAECLKDDSTQHALLQANTNKYKKQSAQM